MILSIYPTEDGYGLSLITFIIGASLLFHECSEKAEDMKE